MDEREMEVMTYVEFFETDHCKNLCASLIQPPERVVLVGRDQKVMARHAARYQAVLRGRGHEVEFVCQSANVNRIQDVIDVLSTLVETYDDCVFDLTGGEDLYLVAMGMVFERYRDKNLQLHRFNFQNGQLYDCDQDGSTIAQTDVPTLSIAEQIRLYGGDIVYGDTVGVSTCLWQWDADFHRDIDALWELCKEDPTLWNTQIDILTAAESFSGAIRSDLTTAVDAARFRDWLRSVGRNLSAGNPLFQELFRAGLLTAYYLQDTFLVTYKNEQVKKCLTKAGQALEMKITSAALRAVDKDGKRIYHEAVNGVCIDWDGVTDQLPANLDVRNEVDVMLMHGMIPVFVSCKNGAVGADELFKLNTVAERFGGARAKKVLALAALDENDPRTPPLRQRAVELNIRILDPSVLCSEDKLQKAVAGLWCS